MSSAESPASFSLSARQRSRSATSAITGYLYQFERSILELLGLNADESICLEAIEDVDLWEESGRSAVQVKYHASQSWTLSAIRKPVLEMVTNFADGHRINYILHVHFGSGEAPPQRLELSQLKDCLTYRPRGKPVVLHYEDFEEDDLIAFLAQFSIRSGETFKTQQEQLVTALQNALKCSNDDARELHHMRAVQFIQEVSIRPDEKQRFVSKDDLIAFLDVRDLFYTRWHRERVGEEKLWASVARKLRVLQFDRTSNQRGLLIEPQAADVNSTVELLVELAGDVIGGGKRRTTAAKPWTVALRAEGEVIHEIKAGLVKEQVQFNDGYESFGFSTRLFSEPPVMNTTGGGPVLARASFSLCVIAEASLKQAAEEDHRLTQLLALSKKQSWHASATKNQPTYLSGFEISELTTILRSVIK